MAPDDNDLMANLDVLIVDDLSAVRVVLYKSLRQLGIYGNIDQAADGLEAWDKLQQRSYGLVICDVNMPRMNGFELRKKMDDSDLFRFIPFLFFTGEVSAELMARATAGNYLIKPVNIYRLAKAIKVILKTEN